MTNLDDTLILFDWNGTIVLDADRARAALNRVLGSRALAGLDEFEFGERFRLPMRDLFRDLGVGADDLVEAEAEWNAGMLHADPVARPNTARALGILHGVGASLGVVSAASQAAVASDLAALALPDVWTAVRGGVADKVVVLGEERGNRTRAFYVGDTVYDIVSAAEAGYRPVGVLGGYTSERRLLAAGAETIIADFDELFTLVSSR